jgi:exopolysaccharide biosynthesis polyprenyl glycosylphosphotransferase
MALENFDPPHHQWPRLRGHERRRYVSLQRLHDSRVVELPQIGSVKSRAVDVRARTFKISLAVADVMAAVLALALALGTLGDNDTVTVEVLAALPLLVLVSKVSGLYDRDELLLSKRTLDEAPVLFQLATLYTLILWFGSSVFIDGNLGREQGMAVWLVLFALMISCRKVGRAIAARITPPERCGIIGSASDCERIQAKIEENPSVSAEVVVTVPVIPGRPGRRPTDTPEGGWPLEDLIQLARDHQLDRLIVAPTESDAGEMSGLMRSAKALGLHVSVLPRMFEVVGSHVEFDELDGMTVLGVRRFELSRSSQGVKRGLDVVGSALGLVALAPFFALMALAIKLDSPGPVFFRQVRIGRDGRQFRIFKFRTMVSDAEQLKDALRERNERDGLFKIVDDPRRTRVGRFLRKTSLDELPQLVNVLRGEMSLVGPRPLITEEDSQVLGWDRRRLHLTPGMTGHWQILGSARIPLREMAKIDYLYVTGWTLWKDIKILVRTVPHVLARRGV